MTHNPKLHREPPDRIPYRDEWADGRESAFRRLDPDPLEVQPRDPPPRRWGCSVLPYLVLCVVALRVVR